MTDYSKGLNVYFRGNPVRKEWFHGKIECIVHPKSGNQFDLVADWAPEFNESYALVTPFMETHERLPWSRPPENVQFVPQCLPLSRLSIDDPSVKTRAAKK